MELKEAEESLRKKIEGDYKQLKEHFQAGQFKKMAKLLGKNVVLATPEGKRLKGKCTLTKFWKSVNKKEREATKVDIDFRLVCLYVSEVKNLIEKKDPQKTIVHTGHEITEFRLISKKAEGTVSNSTGSWARTLCHPQVCMWECAV